MNWWQYILVGLGGITIGAIGMFIFILGYFLHAMAKRSWNAENV